MFLLYEFFVDGEVEFLSVFMRFQALFYCYYCQIRTFKNFQGNLCISTLSGKHIFKVSCEIVARKTYCNFFSLFSSLGTDYSLRNLVVVFDSSFSQVFSGIAFVKKKKIAKLTEKTFLLEPFFYSSNILINKTPWRVFSFEFCEIFQYGFFQLLCFMSDFQFFNLCLESLFSLCKKWLHSYLTRYLSTTT